MATFTFERRQPGYVTGASQVSTINGSFNRDWDGRDLLRGIIIRDPGDSPVTDRLPTLASFLQSVPGVVKSAYPLFFDIQICNSGSSSGILTVASSPDSSIVSPSVIIHPKTCAVLTLAVYSDTSAVLHGSTALVPGVISAATASLPPNGCIKKTGDQTSGSLTPGDVHAGFIVYSGLTTGNATAVFPSPSSLVSFLTATNGTVPLVNDRCNVRIINVVGSGQDVVISVSAGAILQPGDSSMRPGTDGEFVLVITNVSGGSEAYELWPLH